MRKLVVAFLLLLLASPQVLKAAWLENVPQTLKQPDGSILHCFATGDEYHSWFHDGAGYTIMQDPATGYYVYAVLDNGDLVPSAHVAGRVDPSGVGLVPFLNISPDRILLKRTTSLSKPTDLSGQEVTAAIKKGSINNLCVFIRFSDESEFTDLQSKYTTMFNNEAAGANSLRLYFAEASYGQLGIMTYAYPAVAAGSTVISYQDPHPRAYYQPYNATTNPIGYSSSGSDERDREQTLLKAAVGFIAPLVSNPADFDADNDGRVDNVCFIISGSPTGWSSLLWPHRWSLYSQTAYIGTKRVYDYNLQLQQSVNTSVLCHEMSHTVGFPDLYHYTSDGKNPVGGWDLMAANRNPPQHMSAYLKMKYASWIASIPSISASGTYTLQPLTSSTNNAYKITSPNSTTEYFVVEYRKRQGTFESSLPAEGLLVYRINSSLNGAGNSAGPPDEVYIYRPGGTPTADGTLSKATFSSTAGRTAINDTTSPPAFLSDGTFGGLNISEVGTPGATLSFKVTFGGGSTIAFQTSPPGLAVSIDGVSHVTPCAAIWTAWSSHTVSAASPQSSGTDAQNVFSSWSDGGSQSHLVTAPASAASFTATFRTQYKLTMVSSNGGSVNPSSGWHNSGEAVTISALPGNGSSFGGWMGSGTGSYTGPNNQTSVSMNGPITQTANFMQLTSVDNGVVRVPGAMALEQNYPNPFNPVTTIKYTVGGNGAWGVGNSAEAGVGSWELGARKTRLTVYDVLGRQVATLIDENKAPGSYEVAFHATGLPSGLYYYRLTAGEFTETRAMVLVK